MEMTPEQARARLDQLLAQNPEIGERHRLMRELQARAETVADIFSAYRVGVMAPQAGAVQIRETEQAVYAACHMLLTMFVRKLDSSVDSLEDWAIGINKECENYAMARVASTPGFSH